MRRQGSQQRALTLLEILIVLAVLATLLLVVPSITGFLSGGRERAWEADQRRLQAAVDAWRNGLQSRAGNPWPTYDAVANSPGRD